MITRDEIRLWQALPSVIGKSLVAEYENYWKVIIRNGVLKCTRMGTCSSQLINGWALDKGYVDEPEFKLVWVANESADLERLDELTADAWGRFWDRLLVDDFAANDAACVARSASLAAIDACRRITTFGHLPTEEYPARDDVMNRGTRDHSAAVHGEDDEREVVRELEHYDPRPWDNTKEIPELVDECGLDNQLSVLAVLSEGRTSAEIGKFMGITDVRVRQLRQKLRSAIDPTLTWGGLYAELIAFVGYISPAIGHFADNTLAAVLRDAGIVADGRTNPVAPLAITPVKPDFGLYPFPPTPTQPDTKVTRFFGTNGACTKPILGRCDLPMDTATKPRIPTRWLSPEQCRGIERNRENIQLRENRESRIAWGCLS